jgi:hypothetical protein
LNEANDGRYIPGSTETHEDLVHPSLSKQISFASKCDRQYSFPYFENE